MSKKNEVIERLRIFFPDAEEEAFEKAREILEAEFEEENGDEDKRGKRKR